MESFEHSQNPLKLKVKHYISPLTPVLEYFENLRASYHPNYQQVAFW